MFTKHWVPSHTSQAILSCFYIKSANWTYDICIVMCIKYRRTTSKKKPKQVCMYGLCQSRLFHVLPLQQVLELKKHFDLNDKSSFHSIDSLYLFSFYFLCTVGEQYNSSAIIIIIIVILTDKERRMVWQFPALDC